LNIAYSRGVDSAFLLDRKDDGSSLAPEERRVQLETAAEILGRGGVLVLSGAGVSTDSGIPDYRGPESSRRKRAPTKHKEFVKLPEARRRYWARSSIGWPMVRSAEPNRGHRALAELERQGPVRSLITQNVDGLHQAAGSGNVLELHGSLYDVRCLDCGMYESRDSVQQRITELNPGWPGTNGEIAPDGDVELPPGAEEAFRVPACRRCGGVLKPEVVFFGDSVPRERVDRAWSMYAAASSLLVVGSSLAVYSGYRFVRAAAKEGKPVIIINDGETRGDRHAVVKLEGRIAEILPALAARLEHAQSRRAAERS
jgi:NAD-dependent SIR2 family protein deacetylase